MSGRMNWSRAAARDRVRAEPPVLDRHHSGDLPATQKQLDFMKVLEQRSGLPRPSGGVTRREASQYIDRARKEARRVRDRG